MRNKKTYLSLLIVFVLALQLFAFPEMAFAASKQAKSVTFTNVSTYHTLKVGEKKTIKVSVKPKNAKNKKLKWKSSKPSVVSVSSKGVIKAKKKGTATITATTKSGKKRYDSVKVTVGTKVSSVKYTNLTNNFVMKKGEKKSLRVSISPSSASNKRISWSSSKPSVVSISSKGTIKAKKKGTAYIRAKARDGSGKYKTYKVYVGTKATKVSVSGVNYVGKKGTTTPLKATVSPSSASYKGVSWKSSNTSVAKVSSSGKVSGINEGTATISATTLDGTKKIGSFTINVVMPLKTASTFVAHRGYSSIAPENTIPAFQQAVNYGFSAVETDIWETPGIPVKAQGQAEIKAEIKAQNTPAQEDQVPLSEDKTEKNPEGMSILQNAESNLNYTTQGEDVDTTIPGLMIMHDESLFRMCGKKAEGQLITKLNPDQLAAYPIVNGNNISQYTRNGESLVIPSYGRYLETLEGTGKVPVIEIKSGNLSEEAAKELLRELKEKNVENRAVIQSFNMPSLLQVVSAAGEEDYSDMDLIFLYLTSSTSEVDSVDMANLKNSSIDGICMKYTIATSTVISRAKYYGLKVGVWTVDDTTLAYKLAHIDKVDYIISNMKVFK